MIKSFGDRITERIFNGDRRLVNPNLAPRVAAILDTLDMAVLSGYHALRGNRAGVYAVTVSRNYCVTFTTGTETVVDPDTKEEREEFHVYDVRFEDYH